MSAPAVSHTSCLVTVNCESGWPTRKVIDAWTTKDSEQSRFTSSEHAAESDGTLETATSLV